MIQLLIPCDENLNFVKIKGQKIKFIINIQFQAF